MDWVQNAGGGLKRIPNSFCGCMLRSDCCPSLRRSLLHKARSCDKESCRPRAQCTLHGALANNARRGAQETSMFANRGPAGDLSRA